MASRRAPAAAASQAHFDRIYIKKGKEEVIMDVEPGTTLSAFKDLVATRLGVANGCYVQLVSKGKILGDDEATLAKLGLRYGSRCLMMHTPAYAEDKAQLKQLASLANELEALEARAQDMDLLASDPKAARVNEELLTGLLEKMDGVETFGRPSLRATRKALVNRVHQASDRNRANGDRAAAAAAAADLAPEGQGQGREEGEAAVGPSAVVVQPKKAQGPGGKRGLSLRI